MKKYEIMTDSFEFSFSKGYPVPAMTEDEIADEYMNQFDHCPTRSASFDTKEEAIEAFNDNNFNGYGKTWKKTGSYGQPLLLGNIAWIEINEYDEDGEFDQGGDWLTFSAQAYKGDE